LPEFPIGLPLSHNIGHPSIPAEFWSPAGFGLHPGLLPGSGHSLIHPNLLPNYKIPNIHAILSQYMGLNNLFNASDRVLSNNNNNNNNSSTSSGGSYTTSPQNLSLNTSGTAQSISPLSSPKHSPTKDLEK
jgi:hypothetical protein